MYGLKLRVNIQYLCGDRYQLTKKDLGDRMKNEWIFCDIFQNIIIRMKLFFHCLFVNIFKL